MSRKKTPISEINLNTIGGRIAFTRVKNNDSQKEFSIKTGISPGNISGIENNLSDPSYSAIMKVIEVYSVDVEWLLTGKSLEKENECSKKRGLIKFHPAVEKHIDVVKQFNDHEAAVDINQDLVFIERKSKTKFEKVRTYIKGLREGLEDDIDDRHQKKHLDRRKGHTPYSHQDRRKKAS